MSLREPDQIRRSIEVEYWVTDETGRLAEPGELVAASPGAEREFVRPLLEVKTTPCETTAELETELLGRLRDVLDRAQECGKRLVPLATPLSDVDVAEIPSDRIRVQNAVVGEPFSHVRHCAGTHVHVEQQPGSAVDQLNAFVALDPALALVNSAPYYRGRRVAAGARSELYRRRAYADLPHQGRLWPYVSDVDDWTRRLERRYEEFETAALEAGVDRATVAANFEPESAVWTPVQFREAFGTVEWRSPDTAVPGQVLRLADRLAAVVERVRDGEVRVGCDACGIDGDTVRLPPFETVLEHVDTAVDEGLTDPDLRAYLDRMGFDVDAYEPLAHELDGETPVEEDEARRLRLLAADRLERDVRQGVSVGGV